METEVRLNPALYIASNVSNNFMTGFRYIFLITFILQISLVANCQETQIDSTILNIDTATIDGVKYKAIYKTNKYFFILNSKEDTVFKSKNYFRFFEFTDFDNDNRKDLIFSYISNIPIKDLILYDSKNKVFVPVENFSKFPEPIKIKGTKFYYSFHHSGCADKNWDSDLFYIDNFKAIILGNISGRECDNMDVKDDIYIYKIKENKKSLIKSLSIDMIHKFKDDKWGFIEDFWTKNYKEFE